MFFFFSKASFETHCIYQSTRRDAPEDLDLHERRCEDLKSRSIYLCVQSPSRYLPTSSGQSPCCCVMYVCMYACMQG